MDILLITEAELKKTVPISTNVDITTSITQVITVAQNTYIKNLFCEELWDEIQAQVSPGPPNATYTALLEQIKPALCWYAFYYGLTFFSYKTREVGVVKQNSDRATNVDNSELTYVREASFSTAKSYEVILSRYLVKHKNDFGVVCSCECGDNVPAVTRRFFVNI